MTSARKSSSETHYRRTNLYEVKQKQSWTTTKKVIQADRTSLQRLILSFKAGRNVDLSHILSYKLMPASPALAKTKGGSRSGQKSILSEVLIGDTPWPQRLQAADIGEKETHIEDGQAHVTALGKPSKAKFFGDLADIFIASIIQIGALFSRTVFTSFSTDNMTYPSRVAHGRNWERRQCLKDNFITQANNKAALARLFPALGSKGISKQDHRCRWRIQCLLPLMSTLWNWRGAMRKLHCAKSQASSIVGAARNTDLLVLYLVHFAKMPCPRFGWKLAPTKTKIHPDSLSGSSVWQSYPHQLANLSVTDRF